jgi:hypothetical protein
MFGLKTLIAACAAIGGNAVLLKNEEHHKGIDQVVGILKNMVDNQVKE